MDPRLQRDHAVRVRIRKTPSQEQLDGVRLDDMVPGSVREVSPSIGAWLIAERYAEPEMRQDVKTYEEDFLLHLRATADHRVRHSPRRRSHDPR